jgi:rRNA maturation endonuclease Nob1
MLIDPLHLLPVPLILALTGLLALAVAYDLLTFRHRKKKEEAVYRCAACRRVYTKPRHTPLARCPTCGRQNPSVHRN